MKNNREIIILIFSILLTLISTYILGNSISHYIEVYRAIYGIKVKIIRVNYRVNYEKRKATINVIISINNPSEKDVEITGGEGRILLNNKYLGSIIFYVGEGITLPSKIKNYTLTGISIIKDPYLKILVNSINSGELNWIIESWIHFRIGIHSTIIKSEAYLKEKTS